MAIRQCIIFRLFCVNTLCWGTLDRNRIEIFSYKWNVLQLGENECCDLKITIGDNNVL